MKKKIYMLLCSLLPVFALAQNAVKIKVTDAQSNSALPGATVLVKGSSEGASSDNDGMLTVQAKPDDVLEVRMLGYETQTVAVNNQSEITVALKVSATQLTDVVVTGTRSPGRVKTETPVPVDIINIKQISSSSGRMDLTSLLNYSAPSLNYNKQSGADGADHVDLATLRGLGPDQTLVLINGKRRHQTAFVALFGTRGRGNSGTDLNTIPVAAIDHVEILRDGASAQYGSDAIAGVINIVLKKNVKEFSGDIGYAGYYDNKYNPAFKADFGQYVHDNKFDGKAFSFNGDYGIPIGKHDGFINLGINYFDQGKTFRQVSDTSDLFNNEDALPIDPYRRANGDGSVKTGGAFLNAEFPCGSGKTIVYAFGGYNYGESDAYAFTRNFSARPDRFPTDADGELIFVNGIMQTTSDGETYFNPHIQTHISDGSFAAGVKGKMNNNWNWDISNNIGRNDFHFYGDKTFNASLGADKTHFDDGGFSFLQNTSNLNLSKQISGIAQGFNLAGGVEYRYEMYKLYAGEEASYKNFDPTGDKATGSQGFPGYQPSDAVNENRSTVGGYVDAELDVTKKFLITGAVRAENYSDFGFTHNYKMSTRYKVADNFSLRASGSTGFRAPSLQQINFSSTYTTVQGLVIAEVKIAPNYSEITKAAGIPELKQEKAINAGGGFTWSPVKNFNITVDGYWVQVKDRVVLSGQFDGSDATLDPVFLSTLNSFNAAYAQFFANAVNTTNKGVDAVIEYKKVMEKNSFRVTLAGNYQKMTIDKINVPAKLNDTEQHRQTFLSDREQAFILASAPEMKGALSLEYGLNKLTIGMRFTYFGKVTLLGYGEDALGINPMVPTDADGTVYVPDRYIYNGKLVSDIYLSYKIFKSATLSIGADNVFNVHPDYGAVSTAKYWAYNTETGGPWDAVQMGSNGMRLFTRLAFNF
ncbi:MAG TPA: TonB-dependent receptor [Bacteroidia bacterium]|nr:TonB-dependent receptor [Bacteroidia bacterium]